MLCNSNTPHINEVLNKVKLKLKLWYDAIYFVFHISSFLFQKIEAQAIEEFYGLTSEIQKSSESGYILFYEARG